MLNKLTGAIQKLTPGSRRKILTNIGWLFGDRILRMGVGLIVTAWIARYLQPDKFGVFNYAVAFVALFTTLATLGLDSIVVRDIVREPECKNETLGTAFALKLFSGTVTFLLAAVSIFLLRPDDAITRSLVLIISIGTIFEAFNTIDFWFQLQVKSKYTVVAKNTAFLLVSIVRISLLQAQAPLIAFAGAILAENVLGAIGLAIAYKVSGQNIRAWRPNLQRAKTLLSESWPLIISGMAIMIYLRIDQIMLGQMVGSQAVGIYSVTTRISEIWFFIPAAIVSSLAPSIIEAKKVSETLYYSKLQKLFNLMALLGYAIAIPMMFLGKYLIIFMFGQSYASGSSVLAIQIWTGLFCFFGYCKSVWIINEGITRYDLVEKCSGAVMNILLNLVLIPLYQEVGAAIATLVSYAFADYFMCLLYPPTRKLGWVMTKALGLNFFTQRKQFD